MKRIPIAFATMAVLLGVAACSQVSDVPANQQETVVANEMMGEPTNTGAHAGMEMMEPTDARQVEPGNNVAAAVVKPALKARTKATAAERKTETGAAPIKTPDEPAADPHAGHDMSNMSR